MKPLAAAVVICIAVECSVGAPRDAVLVRKSIRPKKGSFSITDSMVDFTVNLSTDHLGRGNTIFSPFSIVSMLNLLLLGATGRTYDELRSALKYPAYAKDLLIHQQSGIQLLALQQQTKGVAVNIANRIFAADRFQIENKYRSDAMDFYQAAVESLDFARKPVLATNKINQWVNVNTNGKIPKLLTSPLPPYTRMVAANVVYFNSSWQTPFNPTDTGPGEFHISPNETILTNMMSATSMKALFGDFPQHNFSCLALPYTGGSHGMYVFLPDEAGEKPLDRLERHLTAENFAAAVAQMKESELDVQLPRFKMEQTLSLRSALQEMGVRDLFKVFSSSLDSLSSSEHVYLDEVLHQAVIDVHERGTEAAAATVGIISRIGLSHSFSASRPFLYVIRDNRTGVPLFWGRMVRPKPSST